jgi:hypothetical protein
MPGPTIPSQVFANKTADFFGVHYNRIAEVLNELQDHTSKTFNQVETRRLASTVCGLSGLQRRSRNHARPCASMRNFQTRRISATADSNRELGH